MSRRFVIQEHAIPAGVHWDLMLEDGDILMTYRLEQPPETARGQAVRAMRIFDHPRRFLTYEGPVQKGTGRVRIVDRGACHLSQNENVIDLELSGEVLQGRFVLTQTEGASWQLAPEGRK